MAIPAEPKFTDVEAFPDTVLESLPLASFPPDVQVLSQLATTVDTVLYLDYSLHELLQNHGSADFDSLIRVSNQEPSPTVKSLVKKCLDELPGIINYCLKLYTATVCLHWFHSLSDEDGTKKVIDVIYPILPNTEGVQTTEVYEYLLARFHVLWGLCVNEGFNVWCKYLSKREHYFGMSEPAGQKWLDLMFSRMALEVKQAKFKEVISGSFFHNNLSALEYACFLLRKSSKENVDNHFKDEFKKFLYMQLKTIIKAHESFPRAQETSHELENYIGALFVSIEHLEPGLIDRTILHDALIQCSSKTFHSHVITSRLVESFAILGQLDEAISSFAAYKDYMESDQRQNQGRISNLLSTINTYAVCFTEFNPANAFVDSDTGKFKHHSRDQVVRILKECKPEFVRYLKEVERRIGFSLRCDASDALSFIKPLTGLAPLAVMPIMSRAWFSLGQFSAYLACQECHSDEIMRLSVTDMMQEYQLGLSYDPRNNLKLLCVYCQALAQEQKLKCALSACKYSLKLYPQSFELWNLLVLVSLALETQTLNQGEVPSSDAARFIVTALNAASLFLVDPQVKITNTVKWSILELKKTQCALLECDNDSVRAIESLPEVFAFYDEIYKTQLVTDASSSKAKLTRGLENVVKLDSVDENTQRHNGFVSRMRRYSLNPHPKKSLKVTSTTLTRSNINLNDVDAKAVLQSLWVWASKMYMRQSMFDECELCIVEAENALEPNAVTFNALALLAMQSRPRLSLEEYKKIFESHGTSPLFSLSNRDTVVGIARLFLEGNKLSLYTSERDEVSGIYWVKNELEEFLRSWPIGYNDSETWHYLSMIYDRINDGEKLRSSLWRCIELEDARPVRTFASCWRG